VLFRSFLDPSITRGFQAIGQVDRFFRIGDRPGAVRFLYGYSQTRQSTWDQLEANGFDTFKRNPNRYNGKHNLAFNAEQELSDWIGAFARLSWNDGLTQNWMYTEMDRAVSAGLSFDGRRWDRAGDTIGLAFNIGWISSGRRRYLEAGGIGFITGDGRLTYTPESAVETYYDLRVAPGVNLAANAQLVVNPAFNADRGPVPIFALRLHTAF
jgi:high affinity Mn2+ porin